MNNFSQFFKNFFLRISLQEKIIFARHLAIMVKAGMPLIDSLTMLKKQTKNKSLKKILEQVVKDVNNGQFLATSLEKFKEIFGELFINIVRVGESSGVLPQNLNYLSDELKKKKELQKKVLSAMIYPIIIMVATTGLTVMLTVFVFPKILPVFASMNVKLPATTRFLIYISDLLTEKGIFILSAGIIGFLIFWTLIKIKEVRFYYDWIILKLPVIGGLAKSINISSFARTLGILLKSGVKIVDALNITADTLGNLVYRRDLKVLAENIQKGEQISKYMITHSALFPEMFTNMISVGENTGNLSETLIYLAEFYDSEVNDLTKNLSNTLEPLLILMMGVIVGFVAISIITPIYGLTQSIRG